MVLIYVSICLVGLRGAGKSFLCLLDVSKSSSVKFMLKSFAHFSFSLLSDVGEDWWRRLSLPGSLR